MAGNLMGVAMRKERMRHRALKPISKVETYLKYGFVIMEHESYYCPGCRHVLNAGPGYCPRYCDQCGQRITFAGIEWKKDRESGYLPADEKGVYL